MSTWTVFRTLTIIADGTAKTYRLCILPSYQSSHSWNTLRSSGRRTLRALLRAT